MISMGERSLDITGTPPPPGRRESRVHTDASYCELGSHFANKDKVFLYHVQ